MRRPRLARLRPVAALAAALTLAAAIWGLGSGSRGLEVTRTRLGPTPVTVLARPDAGPAPVVVIAHGFAGSQQLMGAFAVTLARAGYVAVSYDALGHGRNRAALTGDVTAEDGATARLLDELSRVMDFALARPEADGRLALVGHSMASDIVVRAAIAGPPVAATVAVSLYSRAVTAAAPSNLLVITGALEAGLTDEALRVAGLPTGRPAVPSTTLGDPATGPARRAVLAPGVEHVGVLYSRTTLEETRAWLDLSFGRGPSTSPVDMRGPWLGLWLAATLGLAWGLAPLLPRLAPPRAPEEGWRGLLAPTLVPVLATPGLAWLLPPDLLPLRAKVADYLALHFLIYGLVTMVLLGRRGPSRGLPPPPLRLALATTGYTLFALLAVFAPVDRFVTSFLPTAERAALIALLCACLLVYMLADEALTRSSRAPRGAYPFTKACFLASLGIAIALDGERLFFLVILLPVMVIFFALFGLFSRWSYRATGHALPAALGNAVLFAWALGVTFPLLDPR